jgi:hypothetical protein
MNYLMFECSLLAIVSFCYLHLCPGVLFLFVYMILQCHFTSHLVTFRKPDLKSSALCLMFWFSMKYMQ